MKILIITHEGTFHSDEVVACALIKVFYAKDEDEVSILRVNHNLHTGKELREIGLNLIGENNTVFVVDVGKEYKPVEKLFDHHQWDSSYGKASAGLVFDYIKELIPDSVKSEIEEIVKMSDLQDLGIERANPGSLPHIISHFNSENNYGKEQTNAFNKAVNFTYKYLKALKEKGKQLDETKRKLLSETEIVEEFTREINNPNKPNRVLKFKNGYIPFWSAVLPTMEKFKDVDLVYWHDEKQNTWKVQTVPTLPGGFDKRGRVLVEPVEKPEGVIFIHKNQFFAVFQTEEDLLNYLKTL